MKKKFKNKKIFRYITAVLILAVGLISVNRCDANTNQGRRQKNQQIVKIRFPEFEEAFSDPFFKDDHFRRMRESRRGFFGAKGYHHEYSFKTRFFEEEDRYVLKYEMAGIEEKDIKISYDSYYLTISTESEKKEEDKGYQGSFYSGMSKATRLPTDIDENSIQAKYKNGVLTITIQKGEVKDTRKIIPINK